MSRSAVLLLLFALQAICCAYFLMDIVWDLLWPSSFNRFAESDVLEVLVTTALVLGLAFTGNELRQLLTRHDQLEEQIKVASGAFTEVMEARFKDWSLTNAESEIAILALKGVFNRGNGRDS
jgi:hypothetical protein